VGQETGLRLGVRFLVDGPFGKDPASGVGVLVFPAGGGLHEWATVSRRPRTPGAGRANWGACQAAGAKDGFLAERSLRLGLAEGGSQPDPWVVVGQRRWQATGGGGHGWWQNRRRWQATAGRHWSA